MVKLGRDSDSKNPNEWNGVGNVIIVNRKEQIGQKNNLKSEIKTKDSLALKNVGNVGIENKEKCVGGSTKAGFSYDNTKKKQSGKRKQRAKK